jgi:hypothetical protein
MRKLTILFILAMVLMFAVSGCSKPAAMTVDKTEVEKGGQLTVKWTAPSSFPDNAWIGIIPSKIAHGSESENDKHDVTYLYLKGKTSGTFLFTAPNKRGSWDLRMHDTDSGGVEVASVTFKVK